MRYAGIKRTTATEVKEDTERQRAERGGEAKGEERAGGAK